MTIHSEGQCLRMDCYGNDNLFNTKFTRGTPIYFPSIFDQKQPSYENALEMRYVHNNL